MIYDLRNADLSVVLSQGRLVAEEAKRTFGRLSDAENNWKPSEADWSIGQCFDPPNHLESPVEELGSPEGQRLEQERLEEELRAVDGQLANLVAGLATTGGSATILAAIKEGEQRKLELQAARDRLQEAVPTLTPEEMAELEEALRQHLG